LKEIAYPMVIEFSKTGRVSKAAEWLHADEFNPTGLEGISFVMFSSIGDDELLPNVFRSFGFSKRFCHKTLRINQWTQGGINLLVDHESEFGLEFSRKHGPCIWAMGWLFQDASKAFEVAVNRGAKPYEGPTVFNGSKAVYCIGGSLLFFFQADGPSSLSNYFTPIVDENAEMNEDAGFEFIDHVTNNVETGQMNKWSDYYKNVFGFTEYRRFNIRGKHTGLQSYALKSPDGSFCIPINEGTEEKSQIVDYLRRYKGEGVQHLAFHTKDLIGSIKKVAKQIQFLDIDDEYYKGIFERIPVVKEDPGDLKDLQILLDNDGSRRNDGYLLQIFTREIIGPIFIELIQRENHSGFGEGNFGALFRSMEREINRRES